MQPVTDLNGNTYSTYCAADQTQSEANKAGISSQPCVFQDQSYSSFGALRPGSLRAPSFQNIDMSLSKTFGVWHEHTLAFRADAFNAFNIADYAPPDNNMTDSNFGQITGTVNGNRSISLSLKYAF